MMASVTASCLMAVSAGSKVLLGAISDKSMIGALVIAFVGGVVSICCMWFGSSSPELIMLGGALAVFFMLLLTHWLLLLLGRS